MKTEDIDPDKLPDFETAIRCVPPGQLKFLLDVIGEPFLEEAFTSFLTHAFLWWKAEPIASAKRRPVHIPIGFRKLAHQETAYIRQGQFAGKSVPVTVFHKEEAALVPSLTQGQYLSQMVERFIRKAVGEEFTLQIGAVPQGRPRATEHLSFSLPARMVSKQFSWSAYLTWESLLNPNKARIHADSHKGLEEHIGPSRRRWNLVGETTDQDFVQRCEEGAAWLDGPKLDQLVAQLQAVSWKTRQPVFLE